MTVSTASGQLPSITLTPRSGFSAHIAHIYWSVVAQLEGGEMAGD